MSGGSKRATKFGGAIQVVHYDNPSAQTVLLASIPYDNTIPQISEGEEVLSVSITPEDPDSVLFIDVTLNVTPNTAASRNIIMALFKDSDANAIESIDYYARTGSPRQYTLLHQRNSSDTLSQTYSVRIGNASPNTATIYVDAFNGGQQFYGGTWISSMTIWEVLPNA